MGVTRIGKMFSRKGQKGVFDVSRSKFYKDLALTDPAKPTVPDTNIPRLKLVYLGAKSVAVDDDDTARLIRALQELHADKAAAKAEQRASSGKKKNPPQLPASEGV